MRIVVFSQKVLAAFIVIILLSLAVELQIMLLPSITAFKTNNEIKKVEKQIYKSYSALQGKFKFQLPDAWTTWNETFSGGEILYHLNFISPDKKIHGFIQIWKLDMPLKQFIENSKKAAVGPVDFKYFKTKEIMSGRKKGYLVDYVRSNGKGEYYRSYEAFIEGGEGFIYRASFFTKENDWKQYYIIIFNRIIQSFDIKD